LLLRGVAPSGSILEVLVELNQDDIFYQYMKTLFLITLCLFSVEVFSQTAVRYMSVESDSLLYVHGSFPSAKGDVYVDSVRARAVSFSDTLLVVALPDSGKGSAGPVEVEVDGVRTPPRMLTEWRIVSDWYSHVNYDSVAFDSVYIHLDLLFRFDLHSQLRTNFFGKIAQYAHSHTGRSSCFQQILRIRSGAALTVEEIMLQPYLWGGFYILPNEGVIRVFADTDPGLSTGKFITYFNIPIRQKFSGDSGSTEQNWLPDWKNRVEWKAITSRFDPPDEALILAYPPILIEPTHRQQNVPREDVRFRWREYMFADSVLRIDSFHFQLSTDSVFSVIVFDTTVAATEHVIPSLLENTRYFWRVSGINEEGVSRTYSVPRSFTTDVASAVGISERASNALVIYPNPAATTITYQLKGESYNRKYDVSILNMLGEVVLLHEDVAPNGSIAISGLDEGTYMIQFTSGYNMYSEKLQVIK
jgi:hypothetical protein